MNELHSAFCGGPDGNAGNTDDKAPENRAADTLSEAIAELAGYKRFSTPGHKGRLLASDVTEYDEDEFFPAGRVQNAEREAADFYGVRHARLLTGGSSMGIKAAMLVLNCDAIAPAFTHRSAEEGAELAGKNLLKFDTGMQNGLPNVPAAADYERAFERFPQAKAALVTSPDYFGRTADVKGIAELCHSRGIRLIADCAHGAHFASRPDIFPAGGERFADFSVLSAHKTLRALTMSAVGTVNDPELIGAYDRALRLLGTSSPFYPLLASAEDAIAYERANADGYDGLAAAAKGLRKRFPFIPSDDPMRLSLDCSPLGMTGKEMFGALRKEGILAETYYERYCIFILTLSDRESDVRALGNAIGKVAGRDS